MTSEFLDSQQYTKDGIKGYESVWGEGFVSPGGARKAREFIAALGLPPGARVLDVGCGLGGSAFLMAQEFQLLVDGIDLSHNMIAQADARCRAHGLRELVNLSFGDCLELQADQLYDAVYSRDAFLHIHQKDQLFEVLFRSLRPGGRLLFTDYCCAPKPWSTSFNEYVSELNYCLHTIDEYRVLVGQAGFVEVTAQDLTDQFILTLQEDLERIPHLAEGENLRQGWHAKLERALAGEQRWGLITARRV